MNTRRLFQLAACGAALLAFDLALPLNLGHAQSVVGADEGVDVILVIDDSGSMFDNPGSSGWAGSDVNGLRYSATRLVLHLLEPADRVSVINFGDRIVPAALDGAPGLRTLGDASQRQRIIRDVKTKLTISEGLGETNIHTALETALGQVARTPARPTHILFLTDGKPTQGPSSVRDLIARLEQPQLRHVQLHPIFLCPKSSADCETPPVLREMGPNPLVVRSAENLVFEFGRLIEQIKPNIYLIRAQGNTLGFEAFGYHGLRQVDVIGEQGALSAADVGEVRVAGQPVLRDLDKNVEFHTFGGALPVGAWRIPVRTGSEFAIIRVDTVPRLVFPPPATRNADTRVRYVPAGGGRVLIAEVVGPGAREPLVLNESITMDNLEPGVFFKTMSSPAGKIKFNVGQSRQPIAIERPFEIFEDDSLPRLRSLNDLAKCKPNTVCEISVEFEQGKKTVTNVVGRALIMDGQPGSKLVSLDLSCNGMRCATREFIPEAGRQYRVLTMVNAAEGRIVFGDALLASITSGDTVALSGLPQPILLDRLASQTFEGVLDVSTLRGIGPIQAVLQGLPGVELRMSDVRATASGSQPFRLTFSGMDKLPIGEYTGDVLFRPATPVANVQLPEAVPVRLVLKRQVGTLESDGLDFGTVAFNRSPNARVVRNATLRMRFDNVLFPISIQQDPRDPIQFSIQGDWRETKSPKVYEATVQMQATRDSVNQFRGAHGGMLELAVGGPDFEIRPGPKIRWLLSVDALEFRPDTREIQMDYVGGPGEVGEVPFEAYYTGGIAPVAPSIDLNRLTITASGGLRSLFGPSSLNESHFTILQDKEWRELPNRPNYYRMRLRLEPKGPLPMAVALWDDEYVGEVSLRTDNITTSAIPITIRNPGPLHRYGLWMLIAVVASVVARLVIAWRVMNRAPEPVLPPNIQTGGATKIRIESAQEATPDVPPKRPVARPENQQHENSSNTSSALKRPARANSTLPRDVAPSRPTRPHAARKDEGSPGRSSPTRPPRRP